jgi:hypothetical protein
VTSAVVSVSYGSQKDKVYVGKLGIIGLTTHLLPLSGLVYFGGKRLRIPSLLIEGVV